MSVRGISPGRALRLSALSAATLLTVAPYLWMLSVASKPRDEIFSSSLHLLPQHWALLDNLRDTGLVAPFSISVFGIFLFLQFFRALPDDLLDAARLDGMSEAGIVARVVVPNSWPAVTAFAIFSVVAHWNDLFWPLIVVTDNRVATPPLGLFTFRAAESGSDYGALMAATLIVTLPLVLAFLFAQRRFVEGITMTGLK